MLECKGVIRQLPKCPSPGWLIKYAKGGIPYITNFDGSVKRWCMTVFQDDATCKPASSKPLSLSLDKVDSSDDEPAESEPDAKKLRTSGPSQQPVASTPKESVQSVQPAPEAGWIDCTCMV